MTLEERQRLISQLAEKQTDEMTIAALEEFYYEDRWDYFDELTDQDLEESAKEILG